jgi:hypothetical protein
MGLKFSGCANNYEALVPCRNEPSVLLRGWFKLAVRSQVFYDASSYGRAGIRTSETLSSLTVFKTAGFNHSPTPPLDCSCVGFELVFVMFLPFGVNGLEGRS